LCPRLLCVFLLLLLGGAFEARAERLPIKSFTTADGLAHNDVNRLVKDSRGFLWFCTADGLSRFDGYTFITFGTGQGLPNSTVGDLLETRAGDYWVATDGGLARFDPKGRPGNRLTSDPERTTPAPMFTVVLPDDEDPRARRITRLIEGRDGTIWAGTYKGLFRLEGTNGRRVLRPVDIGLPNDYREQRIITDIVEDSTQSLWIAAPSGLYRRWPDGRAARYTRLNGLPDDFLHSLLDDHLGRLWAGTRNGGFFRFTPGGSAPVIDATFGPKDGLPAVWVFGLFESSDHRFWVGTARGLSEFFPDGDGNGRHFHSYGEPNGLSYFEITALNEDLEGNLWLGTDNAGAMKLTRDGFRSYGHQDGIESVNAVFEDRDGSICFRGNVVLDQVTAVKFDRSPASNAPRDQFDMRLGCFDDERFASFRPAGVKDFGWVSEGVTLRSRSGEWWVGTADGLYRYPPVNHLAHLRTTRPRALYTMKDGLAVQQVYRLFEDSPGNVWISTTRITAIGLARWEIEDGRIHDLSRASGLPAFDDDRARAFGEDRAGNVWIGFNTGLARYTRGRFTFFTVRDGLPAGEIMSILVDRAGRLWLATAGGGLVRVDDPSAARPVFVAYTTAQGLLSNNTEVLTDDLDGRIYVSGARGLDRLDPATGRVKHFSIADGLAPGVFRGAFRDHAGGLWFGMTGGLAHLVPALDTPPSPPPVLISGLRVRGVAQRVSALGERDMSLPDFSPDQNELQIDFLGLGFGRGELLRYQYRLQDADADWSAPSEQRSVTYASLGPGPHTFMVRAVNADGVVSDRPATIAFTILRPVWQRAWFVAMIALAAGGAIYGLHRYRVARLLDVANLRTRIATDLHDDIGANLTRIALLSQVATRQQAERWRSQRPGLVDAPDGIEDGPLASIARIARESVSAMGDIVWAINPARESLLDLIRRMRQHADEVFSLRDIELRFVAPDDGAHLRLGVDVRRDLLLIFKEAVNNAARHSGCSRVNIDFRVEGSCLVLTLADDGKGFDTSIEREGQGLASMHRRARRLNGRFTITSTTGIGTTARLSIPF